MRPSQHLLVRTWKRPSLIWQQNMENAFLWPRLLGRHQRHSSMPIAGTGYAATAGGGTAHTLACLAAPDRGTCQSG